MCRSAVAKLPLVACDLKARGCFAAATKPAAILFVVSLSCPLKRSPTPCLKGLRHNCLCNAQRGYGATAARLTPDQKVGSSNLSGLIFPKVFHNPLENIMNQTKGACWPQWIPQLLRTPRRAAGHLPGHAGGAPSSQKRSVGLPSGICWSACALCILPQTNLSARGGDDAGQRRRMGYMFHRCH